MLDGFKNHKVMLFKIKFDLNELPQNLLDWCENEKIDKIVINFLKIYEQLTLSSLLNINFDEKNQRSL